MKLRGMFLLLAASWLGTAGCGVPKVSVVINEVTASGNDYIELYNGGQEPVDLRGWSLTDGKPDLAGHRFTFTASASVPVGGFVPQLRGVFGHFDFGLGAADAVILYDDTGLVIDRAEYGSGQAAISWCRVPDGTGFFKACAAQTLGRSNVGQ